MFAVERRYNVLGRFRNVSSWFHFRCLYLCYVIKLKGDIMAHIPEEYRHDVATFKKMLAKRGHTMSNVDIYEAWSTHSESFAAGWLMYESDSEEYVVSMLLQAAKENEGEEEEFEDGDGES